jgi:hypothetical protein
VIATQIIAIEATQSMMALVVEAPMISLIPLTAPSELQSGKRPYRLAGANPSSAQWQRYSRGDVWHLQVRQAHASS